MAEKPNFMEGLSTILECDLFSNLFPGEKQFVSNWVGKMLLRKSGLLFSQGSKAEHLYLLLEGHIRVFRPKEGGRDDEIARFAPGDTIGDFDFARGGEYDVNAEALDDATLIMFPGFGLSMDKFALEAPHIISKILLNSAAMVTGRIKSTRKLLIESAYWVQELHRKVYEDPGTGLWKQSFLTDEINQLLEEPMALIMLKPDRFKVLVDEKGHGAGDEAMLKIAAILKSITRRQERGWAMRFKSNETGIVVNRCGAGEAASLVKTVSEAVAALPRIRLAKENFSFTGSIAWAIWPDDNTSWDSLFEGTYKLLLDAWKAGGNKSVRYTQEQPS